MAQIKGRLIKPETMFVDHVAFDLEEGDDTFCGTLEMPVGATLQVGEIYRIELYDGRAGEIRMTSYNDVSTKGEFEGVGPLSR